MATLLVLRLFPEQKQAAREERCAASYPQRTHRKVAHACTRARSRASAPQPSGCRPCMRWACVWLCFKSVLGRQAPCPTTVPCRACCSARSSRPWWTGRVLAWGGTMIRGHVCACACVLLRKLEIDVELNMYTCPSDVPTLLNSKVCAPAPTLKLWDGEHRQGHPRDAGSARMRMPPNQPFARSNTACTHAARQSSRAERLAGGVGFQPGWLLR